MENIIIIANHKKKSLSEIVYSLSSINILPKNDDWIQIYQTEGQIIFELFIRNEKLGILHVGKSAYYIDLFSDWNDFIDDFNLRLKILGDIVWLMSYVGFEKLFAVISSSDFEGIYDSICDGYSLDDIMNKDIIKGNINILESYYSEINGFNIIRIDGLS